MVTVYNKTKVLIVTWEINVSRFNLSKTITVIFGFMFLSLAVVVYADSDERYRQAGHPLTTANMFLELSFDEDASIRKRVASNRKTPKNILLRLANDPDQSVKISVATNLSSGDNVYPILSRDPMLAVRSVVARFEYVPVIALEILAKDKEVDIRLEVARNLNTTKAILIQLTHDSNDSVSQVAEQALQRLLSEK